MRFHVEWFNSWINQKVMSRGIIPPKFFRWIIPRNFFRWINFFVFAHRNMPNSLNHSTRQILLIHSTVECFHQNKFRWMFLRFFRGMIPPFTVRRIIFLLFHSTDQTSLYHSQFFATSLHSPPTSDYIAWVNKHFSKLLKTPLNHNLYKTFFRRIMRRLVSFSVLNFDCSTWAPRTNGSFPSCWQEQISRFDVALPKPAFLSSLQVSLHWTRWTLHAKMAWTLVNVHKKKFRQSVQPQVSRNITGLTKMTKTS